MTVALTLTLGAPVLKALRRATRRAAFESAVTFTPPRDEQGVKPRPPSAT